MAEKSGFFNALNVDGAYDRTYNANDYCDNLAVVISSGVLRSDGDDLKVTAEGLIPKVAAGRGWIKGHYYYNDTALSLAAVPAPVGGNRYDRIMLRLDNSLAQRKIHIVYVQGTASNSPQRPAPTRTESIYDLVLADLYLTANAQSMTVTDTRGDADLCGWVYSTSGDNSFYTSLDNSFMEWFNSAKDTLSSVTLFKRYSQIITLESPTSTVSFDIPQYDPETCFIEVFVNGMFDTRHTVAESVITFQGTLIAGTVVTVNAYKSIDGTGIETVADEITQLQNDFNTVSSVSKYTYKCTGVDDNISLSQIAQALIKGTYDSGSVNAAARTFLDNLGGSTFLTAMDKQGQIQIDVVGKCGVSKAFSGTGGTGTAANKYFVLGADTSNDKRIAFDFSKCDKITVACKANTTNVIFYGNDLFVKNATVYAQSTEAACNITMVSSVTDTGTKQFDNCRFIAKTTGQAIIARCGTFNDCIFKAFSTTSSAVCFYPQNTGGLIRVLGGMYCAYVATSNGKVSAIVCVETGLADAVLFAENIHCPQIAETGYEQKNLVNALSGTTVINNVVSRLESTGTAANYTITNQIKKNKV